MRLPVLNIDHNRQTGALRVLCCLVASASILVGACATYQPMPLDNIPVLASSLDQLIVRPTESQQAELPDQLRGTVLNVADGLDLNEFVLLAILNSPHLRASETRKAEARAELNVAGLLPDLQISASADVPDNRDPGLVTAKSFGLGFDLQSLFVRGSRVSAAEESARAIFLQVLWQEWQVIQQARMLYSRSLIQRQQVELIHEQMLQSELTWKGEKNEMELGNSTLDQEGLARVSMMDTQSSWIDARRQFSTTQHQMAELLGLDPAVEIPLTAPAGGAETLLIPPLDDSALREQLARIQDRRPDLLALRAGYLAQEALVREQVLAQVPSFSVGVNRLRDTSNIWTLGPFINLNLPLFDMNRRNIDLARATRDRLRTEYQDQLASAYIQARTLGIDQRLAYEQWRSISAATPDLELLNARMARALETGNVDMLTFTTLRDSYFSQKGKLLNLQQALLEQSVAIETLLGASGKLPANSQEDQP
jgi:outer membrane protein TolC